jgi:hypothetical protein
MEPSAAVSLLIALFSLRMSTPFLWVVEEPENSTAIQLKEQ